MIQKIFTSLMILCFVQHYYSYGDTVSLVQVGLVLLWYYLINRLHRKDKDYLQSFWIIGNCCGAAFFIMFIAFPLEYGIPVSMFENILLFVLLFFSLFKFTLILE